MRLIFAGTPDFAARALEALLAAGHQVMLVLTQPDRRAGRGMALQASAVKKVALAHGIPVFQPERLKDPATHGPIRAACVEHGAELMVVAAYGLILPQAVLDLPRRGCINIHASLLPRWRGAAPIQRAIEAGDVETGITIMQMDEGLDTGDMLLEERLPIGPRDTSAMLHDALARLGARLIVDALRAVAACGLRATPQCTEGVNYAHKIDKSEAAIDWNESAEQIERRVRAFDPFPGAQARLRGETLKIWRSEISSSSWLQPVHPGQILSADHDGIAVATGLGVLVIRELQRAGGKRLAAQEFLRGFAMTPGERLG